MKRILKNVFVVFLFVCLSFLISSVEVTAKSASSSAFEVTVGDEKISFKYDIVNIIKITDSKDNEVGVLEYGKTYIEDGVQYAQSDTISMNNGDSYIVSNYKLLDSSNVEVGQITNNKIVMNNGTEYLFGLSSSEEKITIPVTLKGLHSEGKDYRWEHTFCYKVAGGVELCETDITGKDQGEDSREILSDHVYSYTFWDGHMPYYSEKLMFEYFIFSNKFVCLEEGSNEVIALDDIEFRSDADEIDYFYDFSLELDVYEKEGTKYVGYNKEGIFINNNSSDLPFPNLPTYKVINEICVAEDECIVNEYDRINVANGIGGYYSITITPYVGNIRLPYESTKYKNGGYENISYKTTLVCESNCESNRRVKESIVLIDETYGYYVIDPYVDEENTAISSASEVRYVKTSDVKITMKDDFSGFAENGLGYYIARTSTNSCEQVYFSDNDYYTFENGETFAIGDKLNGMYCMYFVASTKVGTHYVSDVYTFYFDNAGPTINSDNAYDKDKYYNEVYFDIEFIDYSSIGDTYYLWTETELPDEDGKYLRVKNNGSKFTVSNNLATISSLGTVSDGAYYLYILVYDSLENYRLYEAGPFNIDTTPLTVNDIDVTINNVSEYSSNPSITLSIEQMENNATFKCGFFSESNVVVNMLNINCKNNADISLPADLEGKYSLWAYVYDRASNYSLLEIESDLHIDTKSPVVNYEVLKDDDNYHIINEITLNLSDLNGINEDSLKYGWFVKTKTNVKKTDLTSSFENGAKISYPKGNYGEYKLYVVASDVLGNEAVVSLDKIFKIDTDVIRISLVGDSKITILKGQTYKDKGALAYKGETSSGGRVSQINVSGEVNNKKSGTYYITYTSGEGELLVSVTRTVIVKDNVPYIAISASAFILGGLVIALRLFIRRKENR